MVLVQFHHLKKFFSAYISELKKGLFHVEIFRHTGLFKNIIQIILNFDQGGSGFRNLKSGQGGLIYLYLLSRWFLLLLILFTYSPPRPPSHYLRFQREKNYLRFESFPPLMTTTHWSWMQKMLDILTDISPIQLSNTFAEHYWPHIVPISLPLAQVFLTRLWSKYPHQYFAPILT